MEVTICDCQNKFSNNIITLAEETCSSEPISGSPMETYCEVRSHRSHATSFNGHLCMANKKEKTISSHNDRTTSEIIIPKHLSPRLLGCLAMAGLKERNHICLHANKIMTQTGIKWTYSSESNSDSPFLFQTKVNDMNCIYEQTILYKTCKDCPIATPFYILRPSTPRPEPNNGRHHLASGF